MCYIYKIRSISHKSIVCNMFWPRTQKHRSPWFNRRKSSPAVFGVNRFIHNTLDLPQVANWPETPCCSRKNCWSWHGSCFGACSGPLPVRGSCLPRHSRHSRLPAPGFLVLPPAPPSSPVFLSFAALLPWQDGRSAACPRNTLLPSDLGDRLYHAGNSCQVDRNI